MRTRASSRSTVSSGNVNDSNRNPTSGSEYQDVLSGVMKDAKEREAAQEAAGRSQRPRKGNQPLMLGILVLVSGYLWFGEPEFLQPPPPEPISAELEEAGLRMEMVRFVVQINSYSNTNGRLPRSLNDTLADGEVVRDGFTYQPLDGGRFQLVGQSDNHLIVYESDEPIENLIGNAMQVVNQGVS